MAMKTENVDLYALDPGSCEVIRIGCVTSLEIDGTNENIETTCLSNKERHYEFGLFANGSVVFGINTDPGDESHAKLHQLKNSGRTIQFALGWGDGEDDPVVNKNSCELAPLAGRSWLLFEGYMNTFSFDFSTNAVVVSSISVQIQSDPVMIGNNIADFEPSMLFAAGESGFWPDLTPSKLNAYTSFAMDVPAVNPGDPVQVFLSDVGAEETRNYCLNMMCGGVAGTVGILPQNWTGDQSLNGLIRTVSYYVDTDGVPVMRIGWAGTATNGGGIALYSSSLAAGTAMKVVEGGDVVASAQLKLAPGKATTGLGTVATRLVISDGTGSPVFAPLTALTGLDGTWKEYSVAATAPVGATDVRAGILYLTYSLGAAIDFGIDIKLPHLGKGLIPPAYADIQRNYWSLDGRLGFAAPDSVTRPLLARRPLSGIFNQVTWSEDISKVTAWSTSAGSIVTANEFRESNFVDEQRVSSLFVPLVGEVITQEYEVEKLGRRYVGIRGLGVGAVDEFPSFDLDTGTVVSQGSKFSDRGIEPVAGFPGRYIIWGTAAAASVSNPRLSVLDDARNLSYQGDPLKGIFVYKASVSKGGRVPYQKVTIPQDVTEDGQPDVWELWGGGSQWMTLGVDRFGTTSLFADVGQEFTAGYGSLLESGGTASYVPLDKSSVAFPDDWQWTASVNLVSGGVPAVYIRGGFTNASSKSFINDSAHLMLNTWDSTTSLLHFDDVSVVGNVGTGPQVQSNIATMSRQGGGNFVRGRALPFLADRAWTDTEVALLQSWANENWGTPV